MAAKILDFMDTELERSPCMNGSHTTLNWPNCLCCLHHNSLVMAPKSVFWYQIGSNTELTRSKLLIYLFYFLKKLCNDVAKGLHGSSSSACQGLALNADPLREGMQPFHSPTPSTNELQPKTQNPNPNPNLDPHFDIKCVQTHSKHAILSVFLGFLGWHAGCRSGGGIKCTYSRLSSNYYANYYTAIVTYWLSAKLPAKLPALTEMQMWWDD